MQLEIGGVMNLDHIITVTTLKAGGGTTSASLWGISEPYSNVSNRQGGFTISFYNRCR